MAELHSNNNGIHENTEFLTDLVPTVTGKVNLELSCLLDVGL